MERSELNELLRVRKMQTRCLMEVQDLTRQMADAVNRRDAGSANMLLSMREDPVQKLSNLERYLRDYLEGFSTDSRIRAKELLEGGTASEPDEEPLCEQIHQFRRLLDSVVTADRQLSLKIGGRRSFYRMFRE